MNKEESPYCEICGHCGEIGCCGIESFINNHIKGKTNCKNEDWVIDGIIRICRYETEVFNENELLEKENLELKDYKKMWEELSKRAYITREFVRGPKEMNNKLLELIQELEQKYNLDNKQVSIVERVDE